MVVAVDLDVDGAVDGVAVDDDDDDDGGCCCSR